MVNSMPIKKWVATAASVGLLLSLGAGCSEEGASAISVDLYGWINDGSEAGRFVDDLLEFEGAEEVHISVTKPGERSVLEREIVPINDRSARFPELDGGDGLRMDFELHDNLGPIAAGSTPEFNFEEGGQYRGFRAMIAGVDDFAPVGALFRGGDADRFDQTTFDSRELDVQWSGRVGHTAHATDSGAIMVVGGAQLSGDYEPFHMPELTEALNDIQLFDPDTGYFTELAGDREAIDAGVVGQDRLDRGRAFHTVTPLGDDRFLVVGGFALTQEVTRPQSSIELIDLNAAPGQRVQPLEINGAAVTLEESRGMHTATLRPGDGQVVIAGGLGTDSDDVIGSVEVIDPDGGQSGMMMMNSPRVGHAAVVLDDRETVWLIGGRADGSALSSTEQVHFIGGSLSVEGGPELHQPRYGASVLYLGSGNNNQVAIVGGFTSGGATASYEIGNPRMSDSLHTRQLEEARGQADFFRLPQSGDLLLVGGFDPDRNILRSAQRFEIDLDSLDTLAPVEHTVGSMHQIRGGPATSHVSNGRIVFIGGVDDDGVERNDAEYFTPYDPVGAF